MPIFSKTSSDCSTGRLILTPSSFTPHPATTNATAVEILKVPELSPPVPHTSTALSTDTFIFILLLRIANTNPAISSADSPFDLKATNNPDSNELLTFPFIISFITFFASSNLKPVPAISFSNELFIIA